MNSCLKYKRNEIPYPECNPHTLGVNPYMLGSKTSTWKNPKWTQFTWNNISAKTGWRYFFKLDKRTDYDSTFSKHNKEHNRFYSMTSN
jgi:hypothetical protein